jgi:hypothetical protein
VTWALVRFSCKERDSSFVRVHEPDASESKELVVATDPRRRNDRRRQGWCLPTSHHGVIRICTGRDAEVAKADRGMLVTARMFEMILGPRHR